MMLKDLFLPGTSSGAHYKLDPFLLIPKTEKLRRSLAFFLPLHRMVQSWASDGETSPAEPLEASQWRRGYLHLWLQGPAGLHHG